MNPHGRQQLGLLSHTICFLASRAKLHLAMLAISPVCDVVNNPQTTDWVTGPIQKLCLRTWFMPQLGIEVGIVQAVLLHLLHWMQIVGAAVKLQGVPGLSSWQA